MVGKWSTERCPAIRRTFLAGNVSTASSRPRVASLPMTRKTAWPGRRDGHQPGTGGSSRCARRRGRAHGSSGHRLPPRSGPLRRTGRVAFHPLLRGHGGNGRCAGPCPLHPQLARFGFRLSLEPRGAGHGRGRSSCAASPTMGPRRRAITRTRRPGSDSLATYPPEETRDQAGTRLAWGGANSIRLRPSRLAQ